MRLIAPSLTLALLGGCAGNVADYIGPRSSIVTPQLIRYGLDLAEARCVGERLGAGLSPLQLRRLVRSASAVKPGFYGPGPLTMSNFMHVANAMDAPKVRSELEAANAACNVAAVRVAETIPPDTPSPISQPATAAIRPPAWLNLGAAPTGQQIAVDAASIEQDASRRSAWFRLTDPGATAPSDRAYLLRIDCAARTIDERARRSRDASGATVEKQAPSENPLPVEGGTVMEIAWLALCT
jgi:hypothetical protein